MTKRFPIRVVLVSLGLFLLVILLLASSVWFLAHTPASREEADRVVVIREGASLRDVAEHLEREEIIASKVLFLLWARLHQESRSIKAGEYQLGSHMAPARILAKLTRGQVITHPVTIPEGFTKEQIAALLSEKGLVPKERFVALTEDPSLPKQYGLSGMSLEGYLYPDTYQFARGLSALTLIDTMVRRFLGIVEPFRESIRESGLSLEQVITLASIVEKETGRADERPLIASVFLNRLQKRMRLESDPTVIYGLGNFDGNLTRKDLVRPTAYNTYVIRGLPPGPIANPGRESILAVLYPAATKYLYFVSKNDGSHHFSKTLAEHNRAVNRYQRKKR